MAPMRLSKKKKPSLDSLLSDAETQLAARNLDEAIDLALKALEATGSDGDFELRALNLLGVLHVETGEVDNARSYFERAVKLDEEGLMSESVGGSPEKFLFLAQLSEEGGQDSVRWFTRGASALRKQIQNLFDISNKTPEQQSDLAEKQERLGGVLCAVAEVYMTDLSWEDDAEQRCEALITEAMMIAPSSAETWQTVANVRISQTRVDEAKMALTQSLELWQDLSPEHPAIPGFPTRIALARLLLETEMEDEAISVLERLVAEDDQSIEAWYLGGWCLYIMGEKYRDTQPQAQIGDTQRDWKVMWSLARKWLAQCMQLYVTLDYQDTPLGGHATELLQNISHEIGEIEKDAEEILQDSDEDVEQDECEDANTDGDDVMQD